MTLTRIARARDAAPGLAVSFHIEGPETVVVARGDIDVASVPDLVDMLASVFGQFEGPVVVDLAETEFIDTAAMRVLARARQFLCDNGRLFTLRSPPRQAAGLLRLFGLSHLVTLNRGSSVTGTHVLESRIESQPVLEPLSSSPAQPIRHQALEQPTPERVHGTPTRWSGPASPVERSAPGGTR
jgi:anti-anti-sigma factor